MGENVISKLERKLVNYSDRSFVSFYKLRDDVQLAVLILLDASSDEVMKYIDENYGEDD